MFRQLKEKAGSRDVRKCGDITESPQRVWCRLKSPRKREGKRKNEKRERRGENTRERESLKGSKF